MFNYSIQFLKNNKNLTLNKVESVVINNNHIYDKFYVFRDMTIYSKKKKEFLIIPKGATIKIKNLDYDENLSKIKYKKKKYLVSKEELEYCTFDFDKYFGSNFFQIIEETKYAKLKLFNKKNIYFSKRNIKYYWKLDKSISHASFISKNLMIHIFSHIYESYKYSDNEIFSTFSKFYINNLNDLFDNLGKLKEKKQIKEFILMAESLFIEIKNNILAMQQTPIVFETTKNLLDGHIYQEQLNSYKEIIKHKKELFQSLNN